MILTTAQDQAIAARMSTSYREIALGVFLLRVMSATGQTEQIGRR
jgi:hypothetical protein